MKSFFVPVLFGIVLSAFFGFFLHSAELFVTLAAISLFSGIAIEMILELFPEDEGPTFIHDGMSVKTAPVTRPTIKPTRPIVNTAIKKEVAQRSRKPNVKSSTLVTSRSYGSYASNVPSTQQDDVLSSVITAAVIQDALYSEPYVQQECDPVVPEPTSFTCEEPRTTWSTPEPQSECYSRTEDTYSYSSDTSSSCDTSSNLDW